MAFFVALVPTILNTAFPQSLLALIVLLSRSISHQLYADGGDAYSSKRMTSRSLQYASHLPLAVVCSLGSLACALSNSLPQLVVFRVIQDRRRNDALLFGWPSALVPSRELLPVLNFVAMPGLVGPIWARSWQRAGPGKPGRMACNQYPRAVVQTFFTRTNLCPISPPHDTRFDTMAFCCWPQPCSLLKRNKCSGKDCRQLVCRL